jgi:hypothetical protein
VHVGVSVGRAVGHVEDHDGLGGAIQARLQYSGQLRTSRG